MYAAAELKGERGYLGYVLRGCGTDSLTAQYLPTLPNNSKRLGVATTAMKYVYGLGNFLLTALVLLVSVLLLNSYKKGPTTTVRRDYSEQSLFHNYGIFWGCVTVSFLGNALMSVHGILVVRYLYTSGVTLFMVSGWLIVVQILVGITASLVISIFYGRKFNFSVPSTFLLPFVILCCNRAKETSEKVVRCLSIWSLLLFLFHVCFRANYVFLALLGRPATVISTTLLYIFAVFQLVHLLAIFFTIAKAKKKKQGTTRVTSFVYELAQALAFLVLFATAVCFGTLIGFAGILANYRTVMNSPYSTLSVLIAPTFFAAFGWALRKVGSQWLKTAQSPGAADPEVIKLKPLLQKDGAVINVASEPMVPGRMHKLTSWLML